ncbi:MAG: hypothetical protein JXB38_18565 [Anaerolineales bacterium]|nr:hypothetical protein [Anaerolineales bacterium]
MADINEMKEADSSNLMKINWDQIVSSNWFDKNSVKAIWITGFTMMGINKEYFSKGPKYIDFGDVRAIAFYGFTPYLHFSATEIYSKDSPVFKTKIDEVQSPEGCYLLLYLPFDDKHASEVEPKIRRHIKSSHLTVW